MAFLLTRRRFLGIGGAFCASALLPLSVHAASRDPRFLFLFLRGGVDGLATILPVGDPHYISSRKGLTISSNLDTTLTLDTLFCLNPNLSFIHELYQRKEALMFHAIASPYRERSHFDGQDVLESGLPAVAPIESGWLNRALAIINSTTRIATQPGLAIGANIPIVMRGISPTVTWSPMGFVNNSKVLQDRIQSLYNSTDPSLAKMLAMALSLQRHATQNITTSNSMEISFPELANAAGHILSKADGPRIATLSLTGWDTHSNESPYKGQLGSRLKELDNALSQLKKAMQSVWKDTVIVVATEFGRTVAMNGTQGSDHGTASVAFALGGAIKGGRVITDWPGLSTNKLYQNRDLYPTMDIRSLFKGILAEHFGLDNRRLSEVVFPESQSIKPITNIIL